MDVNKIKILLDNPANGKNIVLPISKNWDFLNRGDTIDKYLNEVLDEVIKEPIDFEIVRFGKRLVNNVSKVTHMFNFYNQINQTYETNYVMDGRFNAYQIFYNTNPFKKSFFKLDFYNSMDDTNKKLYLSIILPTRLVSPKEIKQYKGKDYLVKKPIFELDYLGEQEGFFIYFFEKYEVLELDTLYMSAKFFSGLDGTYTQFINVPQNSLLNQTQVEDKYFYYEYKLHYNTKEYDIFSTVITLPNILNNLGLNVQTQLPLLGTVWYEFIS